jgi:hypothetical protein
MSISLGPFAHIYILTRHPRFDQKCGDFIVALSDDDSFQSGVDNHPFAEFAGFSVFHVAIVISRQADQIKSPTPHLGAGGMDDGVHLGVNRAAEFIFFASRNVIRLAGAVADIDAIPAPSRRPRVPAADNLIVIDYDGAEISTHTRAAASNLSGDPQVIFLFSRPSNHILDLNLFWGDFPAEKIAMGYPIHTLQEPSHRRILP